MMIKSFGMLFKTFLFSVSEGVLNIGTQALGLDELKGYFWSMDISEMDCHRQVFFQPDYLTTSA